MIDFHSHILPGIDDGSESVAESLQMLRTSFQKGIEKNSRYAAFLCVKRVPGGVFRKAGGILVPLVCFS
ncbi:MAG: hypothetical protein LUG54_01055 [Clostridiales bacterium]|nr:hypothetical protein [Clostridiales bacterium]